MLIRDTTTLKDYVSVSVALEYATLKPYIKQVERDYLTKLIGADQYGELDNEVDTLEDEGGDPSTALDLARQAVANLALWKWASSVGVVNISNLGIRRSESDTLKSAFKYQENNLINTFKGDGHNALDGLLQYMEDNIDDFDAFSSSANYTVFKTLWLSTAEEFSKRYNINDSRLVFLRLKTYMTQAQDLDVQPFIGAELYDLINEEYIDNDLTAKHLVLFGYLQSAIAYLSIYRACSDLSINITDKGLYFETTYTEGSYDNKSIAAMDQIAKMAANAKQVGTSYLENARQYMLANEDDFTEYTESTAYNDEDTPEVTYRDNDDKATCWL